jgi:hypothetical protein
VHQHVARTGLSRLGDRVEVRNGAHDWDGTYGSADCVFHCSATSHEPGPDSDERPLSRTMIVGVRAAVVTSAASIAIADRVYQHDDATGRAARAG